VTTTSPEFDPHLYATVQQSMNDLMDELRDVLTRYTRDGAYAPPSAVSDVASVSGFVTVARHQVLQRLRAKLDGIDRALSAASCAIHAHKLRRYGPGYRPLDWAPGGGHDDHHD
jgi:hypothetical protein